MSIEIKNYLSADKYESTQHTHYGCGGKLVFVGDVKNDIIILKGLYKCLKCNKEIEGSDNDKFQHYHDNAKPIIDAQISRGLTADNG